MDGNLSVGINLLSEILKTIMKTEKQIFFTLNVKREWLLPRMQCIIHCIPLGDDQDD